MGNLDSVDAIATALAQVVGGLGLWLVLWLPIAVPLGRKLQWRPFQAATVQQKLPLLVPLYLLVPLLFWGLVRWQQTTWAATGLGPIAALGRSLGLGWAIAALGLMAVTAVRWGGGWLQFSPEDTAGDDHEPTLTLGQRWGTALALIPLGLFLGGIEEWVFRGWMQSQLQAALPPLLAAAIASAIFAAAHLLWDGRAGLRQQPGLWLLGMVLVLARWGDGGQIGLAWGLHGGWVWGLACLDAVVPLQPTGKGPRWWIGRPSQPLTGVLDGLLLLGTGMLLLGRSRGMGF